MKKVTAQFPCECGFTNQKAITKPYSFKASWCEVECAKCGSVWAVTFTVHAEEKNKVNVMQRLAVLSPILRNIRIKKNQEAIAAQKASDAFKFKEA